MSKELTSEGEHRHKVTMDAVVLLCPVMQMNLQTGFWEFPNMAPYFNGEEHYAGGEIRIRAALEVIRAGMSQTILTTGGTEIYNDEPISRAAELTKTVQETAKKLKVNEVAIVTIGRHGSSNTRGNALDTAEYVINEGEGIKSLGILSGATHVRRAMEIFQGIPTFKEKDITLHSIAAESLLRRRGLLDTSTIRVYMNAAQNVIKNERAGFNALRNGNYQQR